MNRLHTHISPPHAPQRAALPADVRLMNAVAALVLVAVVVGAAAALWLWLLRSPLFPIRAIHIEGPLQRTSLPTLRAHTVPQLAGNFFGIDLQHSRDAFESVPWVRRAQVRRVWPDRLVVRIEEHVPVALWEGQAVADAASDDPVVDGAAEPGPSGPVQRLVNRQGEVFVVSAAEVDGLRLPLLAGAEGRAAELLALMQRLQPVLAPVGQGIRVLERTHRGSWRVRMHSGARIELGRGDVDAVLARTERFARTLAAATAPWRAPLARADLRHTSGYAVRLRGVSTLPPGADAAPPAKN